MKINIVISICLIAIFSQSVYANYVVICDGYNSVTSSYVTGECLDGSFEGIDSQTRGEVNGGCSDGGDLVAYDSKTSVYVYGHCEGRLKSP